MQNKQVPIFHSDAKTTIALALVCQGLIPCLPLVPSVAITIDVLELYWVTNLHSPHLSIQAFAKTLCNLHGVSQENPLPFEHH